MDLLAVIFAFIIIVLVVALVFIPTIVMVMGMRWAAEALPSKTNDWIRWGSVLAIMLVIPQIINIFINRDVTNILVENTFRTPGEIPVHILAVKPLESQMLKGAKCENDCVLLLLSGEVEQYLVVGRSAGSNAPDVTAFKFEEIPDCSYIDFLGRNVPSSLENIVREMSLSGRCLTATASTLNAADVLLEYSSIEPSSKLLSRARGTQISVSQKHAANGDWEEIHRSIGVRYREVFPVLLPTFSLEKKTGPLDVLTKIKYRAGRNKTHCKADWFSDRAPCHRQLRAKPASAILGISVSRRSLQRDGVIDSKLNRTISVSKLVKDIISQRRNPNPNEWALISKFISTEYSESETFSELVIDVISNEKFPVPPIYHHLKGLDEGDKATILAAAIQRIGQDSPGPIIGNADEKQQWRRLYDIVKLAPTNLVEPHFDDLVKAASRRPNKRRYVDFLGRFGAKSEQPILDLLKSDKKRLSSLSKVMCRMGSELTGIEGPLMEMAKNNEISVKGNYGAVIYLLLELGVQEEELLGTVNPASFQASSHQKSIQGFIDRYNAKGKQCRY